MTRPLLFYHVTEPETICRSPVIYLVYTDRWQEGHCAGALEPGEKRLQVSPWPRSRPDRVGGSTCLEATQSLASCCLVVKATTLLKGGRKSPGFGEMEKPVMISVSYAYKLTKRDKEEGLGKKPRWERRLGRASGSELGAHGSQKSEE